MRAPRADSYAADRAFSPHAARFHLLIAALVGSEQVREAFEHTDWHSHIDRLRYHRGLGPRGLAGHRRVADAALAGDPAAADEAMRAHLTSSHGRSR